jgi:hypothetical protein
MSGHDDCGECGGRPGKHPTVFLEFGRLAAEVDEEIAPLVLACWRAGIETDESCQGTGDGDECFLSFPRIEDYAKFADRLMRGGPRDELYERMVDPMVDTRWYWTCIPFELDLHSGFGCPSCYEQMPVVPGMFCTVTFPCDDFKGVLERFIAGAGLESYDEMEHADLEE